MSGTLPASTDAIERWEVLDLLTGLVEKSLAVYEQDEHGNGRYRLLETVRQYGRDRLLESGETEAVRSRHLGAFAELVAQAEPHLRSREQLEWLDRLESEHDNLRVALAWSTESERVLRARVAASLTWFWILRGHWKEGSDWLGMLVASDDESGEVGARADILAAQSLLTYAQGDLGACEAAIRECLRLPPAANQRARALALIPAGILALIRDDREAAAAAWREGLSLARAMNDRWTEAWILVTRGAAAALQGDEAHADGDWSEGLPLAEALGERFLIGVFMGNMADLALRREEFARARGLLRRGLEACLALGRPAMAAAFLELTAALAGAGGQPRSGAQLLGAAAVLRETYHYPIELPDQPHYEERVMTARANLGEEEFAAAWAQGQAMPLDKVLAAAWSILSDGEAEIANPEAGSRGAEGSRRDE